MYRQIFHNVNYRWDPITNEWTEGIPMTSKRVGHGVVYLRDTIYSLGGRIESPYINTVEAFHIKGEVWESKASMRNTNAYFGVSAE